MDKKQAEALALYAQGLFPKGCGPNIETAQAAQAWWDGMRLLGASFDGTRSLILGYAMTGQHENRWDFAGFMAFARQASNKSLPPAEAWEVANRMAIAACQARRLSGGVWHEPLDLAKLAQQGDTEGAIARLVRQLGPKNIAYATPESARSLYAQFKSALAAETSRQLAAEALPFLASLPALALNESGRLIGPPGPPRQIKEIGDGNG